jgi:hypothetical protein
MAIDAAHRAGLQALLKTFASALALEMRCELARAPSGEYDREAARADLAGLEASVEQWNAAVERDQAAPQALWRRLASSARDHGITEPPFMVGALIDHLATHTLESSRSRGPGAPWETTILQHYNDRLAGDPYVSVYLLDRRVATLPGGAQPDVQRRVEAADALIRSLFDDARTCAEARQVADARDSLLALKQRLLSDVAGWSRLAATTPAAPSAPHAPRR